MEMNADDTTDIRPLPLDLSHHYSATTRDRHESKVKGFYKYFGIPGIKNIAGGLPNNNYFPFDTLEAAAAPPDRWRPSPYQQANGLGWQTRLGSESTLATSRADKSRVLVPKTSSTPDVSIKIDLKSGLQYGTAQGYPPLFDYLQRFVKHNLHPNVPYKNGPGIILTTGATDGFCKTLEALSNQWHSSRNPIAEKEGILVEEFAYMNAVQSARARGLNIVPVAVDEEGMCNEGAGGLLDVLENWDTNKGKRPHLIYTVTTGQNPTSGVLSLYRRRAIYDLCVKYDIVIIEDDPYWFLQYPSAHEMSLHYRNEVIAHDSVRPGRDPYHSTREPYWYSERKWHIADPLDSSDKWKSSGFPFLDSLVPSYLAVDYQGRVVRLDTFSKTVAPGCRLGWITTQPALCERLLRITETATQQPSGFVQALVAELLIGPQDSRKDFNIWETGGWVRWLEGLRGAYEKRMQTMCSILEEGRFLIEELARLTEPPYDTGRHSRKIRTSDRYAARQSEGEEDGWTTVSKIPLFTFPIPQGGMFIWVHLNLPSHPLWKHYMSLSPSEPHKLAEALFVHLTKAPFLVLCSPGVMFAPSAEIREDRAWQYLRLCFAAVDENEVAGCSKRFVQGVRSFWEEVKDVDAVEALREDDEELGWGAGEWAVEDEGVGVLDLRGGC